MTGIGDIEIIKGHHHNIVDFRTTEFSEYADFTEWIPAKSMRE